MSKTDELSHLGPSGAARMVDVGLKKTTARWARARGDVLMTEAAFDAARRGNTKKGEVLSVAQLAGIMAAKKTSELIPLCHPLPLDQVEVDLNWDEMIPGVIITATVRTSAKTGVEMEALTAVSVAALTVYDMVKSVEHGTRIQNIRLLEKHGGRSGDLILEDG